jgi:hypothetical protein
MCIEFSFHCVYHSLKWKPFESGTVRYPWLLHSELNLTLDSWLQDLGSCFIRIDVNMKLSDTNSIRGCIQKFPDWPPGARTLVQLSATRCSCIAILWVSLVTFAAITPLCCFSTNASCCCLFRYRLSPETFGYTLVYGTGQRYVKVKFSLCLTTYHAGSSYRGVEV